MYSGKTTELLRLIKRYSSLKNKIMVINYSGDTRYGNEKRIYTHDKNYVDALHLNTLSYIFNNTDYTKQYNESDIIFINEGQFFDNLLDFTTNAADNDNKTVIICGLDGDYLKKPFGDILNLIPHSDKITRLEALCKICGDGTPGIFTKRLVSSNKQKLIGGEESYIPVCRKHY